MYYQSIAKNGIGVGWLGVVRFVQSQALKIGGLVKIDGPVILVGW